MLASPSDQELLLRMFTERDFLEFEIFNRVYGIEAPKYLNYYRTHGTLPGQVRDFCHDILANTTSRLPS